MTQPQDSRKAIQPKRPPVEQTCEQCGAVFFAVASKVAIGEAKFCRRACYYDSMRGRAPSHINNAVPLLERFMRHVQKTETCWLWDGAVTAAGYGTFEIDGVQYSAHRASWLIFRGPIPDGMNVCHTCDVRLCVKPDDLFLGSQLDNIRDMDRKGRRAAPEQFARYGTDNANAKLTDDAVRSIRARHATGERISDLALAFGVSRTVIGTVVHLHSWRHVE